MDNNSITGMKQGYIWRHHFKCNINICFNLFGVTADKLTMKPIRRQLQSLARIKIAAQTATAVMLVLLLSSGTSTGADFTLDCQDDNGAERFNNDASVSCGMSYIADRNCSAGGFGSDFDIGHDDQSAFMQEQLFHEGQIYFHVLVGDNTTDEMALEYFIKANSGNDTWDGRSGNIAVSHSLGQLGNGEPATHQPYSPDSSLVGTGSANPNSIIMRQLITDSTDPTFSMDFIKDRFLYKPKLIHTNGGDGFIASTIIDMSNSLYTDLSPIDETADFDNSFVLTDPLKNGTEGDYNVDTMGDIREFRAGGYTYTPGSGTGGSGGTYSYIDPSEDANPAYDPMNQDWVSFCNTTQNVDWSGSGACTNGDGSGGGHGGGHGGGGGGGWGGWH